MASSSTSIFTGSSQFSTDFQNVINRRVAIASLPLRQMQADVQALQSQSTEISSLASGFAGLHAAIAGLELALGAGSFGSAVSDAEVASAALTGTPLPGTFSVEVVDLGVYASSMSGDGFTPVSDAAESNISDAASFTLQVGGVSHIITPAVGTLAALAEAINLSSVANVQATIVNIGSPGSPDYRLSLQAINLGDTPVQLTAIGGANPGQVLMNPQNIGSNAQYRVNGQPSVAILSDSRTVTISPGVTLTLFAEGSTDVTVSRSTNAASSALTRFVTAYNAAQGAIDRNRGEGEGALHGQSILRTLSGGLHSISQYTSGDSGMSSLASLGLSFDSAGVLSFDAGEFSSVTSGKIAQLSSFLGSASTGGFLKAAADTMETVAGDENGILTLAASSLLAQIEAGNQSIAGEEERIAVLRTQVEARMAAADAAIAALEQQSSYMNNLFTAMRQANENNR